MNVRVIPPPPQGPGALLEKHKESSPRELPLVIAAMPCRRGAARLWGAPCTPGGDLGARPQPFSPPPRALFPRRQWLRERPCLAGPPPRLQRQHLGQNHPGQVPAAAATLARCPAGRQQPQARPACDHLAEWQGAHAPFGELGGGLFWGRVRGSRPPCRVPRRELCRGGARRARAVGLTVPLGFFPVPARADGGPLGSGELPAECASWRGGTWAARPRWPRILPRLSAGKATGTGTAAPILRKSPFLGKAEGRSQSQART